MEDLSIDREPYPGQLGTHIREFWTTTGCDTVPDCQPEQPIEALKAIPNGSAATDYDVMVGGKDSGLCWILHKPESLPPSKSLAIADRHNLPRYVAHQAQYSLVTRDFEWELMPLGLDQKVGTMVWSPLASGRLTGKIRRDHPLPASSRLHKMADQGPWVDNDYFYRVLDTLYDVVEETGKSVPQIALNWLLQKPTVSSIIVGARDEVQLRENLGAIGWNLTPGTGR